MIDDFGNTALTEAERTIAELRDELRRMDASYLATVRQVEADIPADYIAVLCDWAAESGGTMQDTEIFHAEQIVRDWIHRRRPDTPAGALRAAKPAGNAGEE